MTIKEFEFQYALGTISFADLCKIAERTKSKKILTILSNNNHWIVRYWVTKNFYTPIKVLNELSYDGVCSVKDSAVRSLNELGEYYDR